MRVVDDWPLLGLTDVMDTRFSNVEGQCPVGCANCRDENVRAAGEMKGRRLVLAAGATFLLPLILGGAGAALGSPGIAGQMLGALIGLAAGLGLAILASRRRGPGR